MTKEEAKQYIRNQIDSCVKDQGDGRWVDLCYNKQYIRALKLSKITGKIVNSNNFKGGIPLFGVNHKSKIFWYYRIIPDYLRDNYSPDYFEHAKLLKEVFKEYSEYKDYKAY